MTNNNSDYQYNRCSSRGICSINPTTASLQEVILLYLKYSAYYALELEKFGQHDKRIINLILNTISILSSNYEISPVNFEMINSAFKTELPRIINNFENISQIKDVPDTKGLLELGNELNDYIRYGEKEFNNRLKTMSSEERNLYRILFTLVKSLCINILIYESFEQNAEEDILSILEVLNLLNTPQKTKKELKKIIDKISDQDCHLMNSIRHAQEEMYGEQEEGEVSFSTEKGKAILVVGSNIRELEQILDVFKDENVDIYTHDNMILAHTFPKFREYKNLKGQYGQGMESCLLDFSTFPGPIVLTRNSLFNVESLYRGRLYTTDFSYSKGVIQIKNNDFSQVKKSAEESKGFKTGKKCKSEKIGFSIKQIADKIIGKLSKGKFKQVYVIGNSGYSKEEREYFKSLIKHVPQDILVISLSWCEVNENTICVNAANDIYGMNRLLETILKVCSQKITVFFPYSDRHTLSIIINTAKNNNVFIGKWNQTFLNPNIIDGLKSAYGVLELTTPKNDLILLSDVK